MSEKEIYLLTKRVIALESTRATKVELDTKLNAAMTALDSQFTDLNRKINANKSWLQKCDDAIKSLRSQKPTATPSKSIWDFFKK